VADPKDRQGRTDEPAGLSRYASSYRKAEPYVGASFSLAAAVGVFTFLGHLADSKLENETPWLTLVGAFLGMTGGFISFFKTVLGASRKKTK
jgi:F0F1-type ATP synthase assembly protein I